jgi:hypothetical protein
MKKIAGSYFEHKRSNRPDDITFHSFAELVDLFRCASEVPRHPNSKDGVIDPDQPRKVGADGVERDNFSIRPSTPAICPAQYAPNTTRAKANVIQLGWIAADCDDLGTLTTANLCQRLSSFNYLVHSTTKSRRDNPRVRVIVETSRDILADEWPHVWHAFGLTLGGGLLDQKTKDASRLSFVPANWEGSDVEFYTSTAGQPIDVDALMTAHPFVAPHLASAPRPLTEIEKLARALAAAASKRRGFDPTVLPPWVIETLDGLAPSGRFFTALKQHAKHCLSNGYAIGPDELFDVVNAYYRTSPKSKPRPNGLAEATHALDHATQNISTANKSSLDGRMAALMARF